jgi:Fe-S cluster biogenesis protein NfuA
MENTQSILNFFESTIRPLTRVDGGDLRFEDFSEGVLTLSAYGACATCYNCEERLKQ